MRDIAVAVALYNNEKEVIEFATNLSKQTLINRIQLLVTCNACKNVMKFENKLHEILPSAMVFDPKENLGYLNGCLYGVREKGNVYSWVMVSNTDIVFNKNDFFEKVTKDIPMDVWCVGPNITLASTGGQQNPFLIDRPTYKKFKIWKTVYSVYPLFWLYFKLSDLKPKKTHRTNIKKKNVYAVHGSCFLLKKECVDKVLNVCQGIFMYGEELLIAEVIRKSQKKTLFNSSVKIIHNENQVTGKVNLRRKQKWFKESIEYISLFTRGGI